MELALELMGKRAVFSLCIYSSAGVDDDSSLPVENSFGQLTAWEGIFFFCIGVCISPVLFHALLTSIVNGFTNAYFSRILLHVRGETVSLPKFGVLLELHVS
jgi:hypothetical protein